jgi:hypothetical protein
MSAPTRAAVRWPVRLAIALSLVGPVVAASSYFPAQDGPNHLFIYHAVQELTRPGAYLGHFFYARLAGHYTYVAVEHLVLLLASFMPLAVADRVTVMLAMVALPLSIIYCLRRLNPRAPEYTLAAPLFGSNWLLHMGFWNQIYGTTVCFLALGYALPSVDALDGWQMVATGALLFAATVVHPLAAITAMGVLGLGALLAAPARARLRAVGRVTLASAPGLLLFAHATVADMSGRELVPLGLPVPSLSFETIPKRALLFFGHVFMSARPWALAVEGLLFLLLGGAVLAALRSRLQRNGEGSALEWSRADMPLGVAAALYLLYLILPETIGRPLAYVPERLPLVILVLVLAWLPPLPRPQRRAVSALLVAAAAFFLIENTAYVRQWNRVLRAYTGGADRLAVGARVLPVYFDTVGETRALAYPMVQAWGYYAVSRDLVSPYTFGYQAHTAIGFHPDVYLAELGNPGEFYAMASEKYGPGWDDAGPDLTVAQSRDRVYARLLEWGRRYDYLLAWRPPDRFVALAAAQGFTTVYATGHVLILRPPGRADPPPRAGTWPISAVPWNL